MGLNSHDRDLRLARATYIGAVRRFDAALCHFDGPTSRRIPALGPKPRPWTARHAAIMRELVEAVTAVVDVPQAHYMLGGGDGQNPVTSTSRSRRRRSLSASQRSGIRFTATA